MANVLSYFTYNIAQSGGMFYVCNGTNISGTTIYIYYKDKVIYNYFENKNVCYITNYLSNICKSINKIKRKIIYKQIITNKFHRDLLFCNYIYFKQDYICFRENFNYILYFYKFIRSIRYKDKITISSSIVNFTKLKYFYNKSIYMYIKNAVITKYTTYAILIPKKYELYYYSNYFHIYFAIIPITEKLHYKITQIKTNKSLLNLF